MVNKRRRHLLVVDDEPFVRNGLVRTLERAGYVCESAEDASAARARLVNPSFDLVLCDIQMPGESGLNLLDDVALQLPDTGFLMVTAEDDPAVAKRAIEMGAYGYVVKPFTPNEILISVINALARLDLERSRRLHDAELESKLIERSDAVRKTIKRLERDGSSTYLSSAETVDRLTRALTLRDEETGRHIERVGLYSELLAERSGLSEWSPTDIRHASMLHDVGKIGVSDAILTKPDSLTADEVQIVRRHCELGYELLAGSTARLLNLAASIALTHHEMWDGSGYPYGLAEDEIPIEGRLVAVADTFDAMTSDRIYRGALPVDEVVTVIRRGSGRQFDPTLVSVFVNSVDEFRQIKADHPDEVDVPSRVRVLLVDDQQLFLEGLSRLVETTRDLTLVGRASSVAEAVAMALEAVPDVIVLDWHLPDGTGADVARVVRSEHPSTRIVVLTGDDPDSLLPKAIDAGCSMVLAKIRAFEEIASAVRSAYGGEVPIPISRLPPRLARGSRRSGNTRSGLTPRELEILALLAEGLSNEAIADSLTLSLHTVRNHVQRLITKLNAHSKLEAVAQSLRQGLIQPPGRFPAR